MSEYVIHVLTLDSSSVCFAIALFKDLKFDILFFFSLNFLAYHSSSVCNENGELFSFIGSSMI